MREFISDLVDAWKRAIREEENANLSARIRAGRESGIYSTAPEDLQVFKAIRDIVSNRGVVRSDNTLGDALSIPLSETKGHKTVWRLGDISLTRTDQSNESPYRAYEDWLNHAHYQHKPRGIYTLESKGLKIISHANHLSQSVFLRFDKGSPQKLHSLHSQLCMIAASLRQPSGP